MHVASGEAIDDGMDDLDGCEVLEAEAEAVDEEAKDAEVDDDESEAVKLDIVFDGARNFVVELLDTADVLNESCDEGPLFLERVDEETFVILRRVNETKPVAERVQDTPLWFVGY